MKITADQIKAAVAEYYRYKKQFAFVSFEADSHLDGRYGDSKADVLIITFSRYLIEVEVKLTMSDLRKDKGKKKHANFRSALYKCPTHWFYFAVPIELANKAVVLCEKMYPYAGVIGSDGRGPDDVHFYRRARALDGGILTFPRIYKMCRSQSATLCRLARKLADGGD